MDIDKFSFFSNIIDSGETLTSENWVRVQTSLSVLQHSNDLRKVYFWGVLQGVDGDYYISFGFRKDALNNRIYFYSTNAMDWYLLQKPPKEVFYLTAIAPTFLQGYPDYRINVLDDSPDMKIPALFQDSQSLFSDEGGSPLENIIQLKEEARLGAMVRQIMFEAAIAPRGSLFKRTDGRVLPNPAFQGLNSSEAKDLKNYFHLRRPHQTWEKNLSYRNDYNYPIDFMDPISEDCPNPGTWTVQFSYREEAIILHNLFWPGFTFAHSLETPYHGFIYVGKGKKMLDVPFMI